MRSKIILMLVSTSFIYSAYAQCWNTIHTVTTDPNNPNNNTGNTFDWTADNTINWYYDFNQSHPVHLPYYCNGSQSTSINDGCSNENIGYYALIKNNNPGATQSELNKLYDILPSDGWELISYSFGIASAPNRMPHIILYNKFTGKLKIFVMAVANSGSSIGNTRAAVYVTWSANSTAKTALFAHAEPISPVMRYFNQSLDVVSPNSIVSLSGFGSVPDYQWLQAEMTAAYDPCTCQNILDGHGIPIIDISIQYFTSSDVSLFGTVEGEFSPASFPYYSGNGLASGITTDGSSSFWSALQNGYGSVMKGYKDWTDYANDLKDILTEQSGGGTGSGSSITTNNIFINSVATSIYTSNNLGPANQTQSYINSQVLSFLNSNSGNAVAEASGVNDLLTGTLTNIASALPYVGAFLGVVDFVSSLDKGKSNKPSPPTTFKVHEKISLSGTITGHSTLNNQTISVPGSNSTYGVGSQAPIYNNIMGVLNIGEIPSLMKKQITVTNHGVDPAVQNSGGTFFSNGSSVPWTIQDYKLSAPLKYMLNPAAGLTVHSIDAAFVFEYNYDDNLFLIPYFSSTNMNEKQVPYYPNGYSYR